MVCPYTTARRGQRTVALVRYGRERGQPAVAPKCPRSTASEPTVALHRSARVVRAVNVVH